jgi:Amt family ammonium transporter
MVLASKVAVNTTLAPCVSGLVVFILRAKVVAPKLMDVSGFCNGILAGLVSITAGCANVKHWEALIIGFVAAFVYQGASMLLKKLKVDDVVDAIPVHGACGAWGVLALGLFGNEREGVGGNGLFYAGDQFGVQVMGVSLIILWTGSLSILILLPLRLTGMLRLSDAFQEAGADEMEHYPKGAYEDFSPSSPRGSRRPSNASTASTDVKPAAIKEEANVAPTDGNVCEV